MALEVVRSHFVHSKSYKSQIKEQCTFLAETTGLHVILLRNAVERRVGANFAIAFQYFGFSSVARLVGCTGPYSFRFDRLRCL